MRKKTQNIALTAIIAALAVAILYIASFLPTLQITLVAVAGFLGIAVVVSCGLRWGVGCWAVASLLSLLLIPVKDAAAAYALFFGIYPVLKAIFEKIPNRVLEWVVKLAYFNVGLICYYFLYTRLFMQDASELDSLGVFALPLANVVFILLDIVTARLATLYRLKLEKHIRRGVR